MIPEDDKLCEDCEFAKPSKVKRGFFTGKLKSCIASLGYICEKDPLKPVYMGLGGCCSDREQTMMAQYPDNN